MKGDDRNFKQCSVCHRLESPRIRDRIRRNAVLTGVLTYDSSLLSFRRRAILACGAKLVLDSGFGEGKCFHWRKLVVQRTTETFLQ
jgi:hypothetical protein